MATFDDREKAFEGKYAHDEEVGFKVTARRNRLLGLWAAEVMGLSGQDAEAYAMEVVDSDFERTGEEDVFEKVWGDLQKNQASVSEHQVRRQMEALRKTAREQISTE
ncbi:MAG: DUF1476 domain-containing protein [Proteobacteria bacterium]|nr:DUF1476 domain-containing protein [Pseudomonadota bacterium]